MAKHKLSAAVAEKYELVGMDPAPRVFTNIGYIDFTRMELALADQLYKSGFKYLKLKSKPKSGKANKKDSVFS